MYKLLSLYHEECIRRFINIPYPTNPSEQARRIALLWSSKEKMMMQVYLIPRFTVTPEQWKIMQRLCERYLENLYRWDWTDLVRFYNKLGDKSL